MNRLSRQWLPLTIVWAPSPTSIDLIVSGTWETLSFLLHQPSPSAVSSVLKDKVARYVILLIGLALFSQVILLYLLRFGKCDDKQPSAGCQLIRQYEQVSDYFVNNALSSLTLLNHKHLIKEFLMEEDANKIFHMFI